MSAPNAPALPVVIIGAGPVGLAAAAHLLERGLTPLVLEAGGSIAHAMRQWGHVRLFSPWSYCVDTASERLLSATGWRRPEGTILPTGQELIDQYLEPLAVLLRPYIRLNSRVTTIARPGLDKVREGDRAKMGFAVDLLNPKGEERIYARAVIDASGTWEQPNPVGANGTPALGERALAGRIAYGIPDVLGRERAHYASRRVMVVGRGHSAMNVLLDLATLKREAPGTEIIWAMRRTPDALTFGGGTADGLTARGDLGSRARAMVNDGSVSLRAPFAVERMEPWADGSLRITSTDGAVEAVDRVVAATGFRPNLDLLRDLRVGLDPWLETTPALAPQIDPNLHSCGSVKPHGAAELSHPEPNFYIAGMKSYGRAPTFLMLTGYEQVRSIAAALAGDHVAAARVELVLPETGVCITDLGGGDCCPAPSAVPASTAASAGSCSTSNCATPAPAVVVTVAAPVAAPVATVGDSCCGPRPKVPAKSACCG